MDYFAMLRNCTGFDWDAGNSEKNKIKHNVSKGECEQAFFNRPILVVPDEKHSMSETRILLLGKTNKGRRLTIIFTVRKKTLIRIISARDMSKKERNEYEKI